MGIPKVILADTDEKSYLSPLEVKFLEELNDEIELEVITDPAYFKAHFSTPQSAEILVVSEELYFGDLQKQNISNIFVLSENIDEGGTEDLRLIKIFKYTNTTEIYNQIIATSAIIQLNKDKETSVVLFYSAAGGVGKTTLSMVTSYCLAKKFKKVLYINAQRINSFEFYLNNTSPISSSVYSELINADSDVFDKIKFSKRNEGFDYIPPFAAELSSLNLDFNVYEKIIDSAKATKEYDVIIVDTDTVFDSDKASLITKANKVVIVTTQSRASVNATNMLLNNMNCNDGGKYLFVCNDFDPKGYDAFKSNALKLSFSVNEYIRHIPNIDELRLDDISNDTDIQKLSFLVV